MCNREKGEDCEASILMTFSLVSFILVCIIILFNSYKYRPPVALSRFELSKQLYDNRMSNGSYKDLDKCTKVVTRADEVVFFGKLFKRPHPSMRPMFNTVFHNNNRDDWLRSRKTLVTNILAPKIVKSFEPIMSVCAAEVLDTRCLAGIVEVVWLVRLYVNKVLYRCVFGGDGCGEEEFIYWSTKLRHEESEALKRADQRVDGAEDTEAELYFKKLIWSPETSEESFLSKLKAAFSPSSDDVESNSVSFILGGFTACVSALVFVMYELAALPDLQEALRVTPVPHRLFTLVVKEGLRKYPPFAAVIKTEDSNVSGTGEWVLPVSGIHHDARVYHEPSEFLPDREYPKHMFCSFGVGARKCPGEHFSYSAVEAFLKYLVKNFKISRKPTCNCVPGKLELSKGKFTTIVDSLELLFEGL